jgi:hypothetical protein
MDNELIKKAPLGDRPFLRSAALASGIEPNDSVKYTRIFRNVYISSTAVITPQLRAEAALLSVGGGAFLSHLSAAQALGFPIPSTTDVHVSVLGKNNRKRRSGIICHTASNANLVTIAGLPVTRVEQTIFDLSRVLPLVDLVVVLDHALNKLLTSRSRLENWYCDQRMPTLLKQAMCLMNERSESPMETRVRLLLHFAGLPAPEVNPEFGGQNGQRRRRYDFCWRSAKVIVEYDGRQHIEREAIWTADIRRREEAEANGWRFIVLTADDVYKHPEQTILRVNAALQERKCDGVPRKLSNRWREHFLVR